MKLVSTESKQVLLAHLFNSAQGRQTWPPHRCNSFPRYCIRVLPVVRFRMLFSRDFFRAAALCSFVSAFTTLGLIFLHHWYPAAQSLEERVAREAHPVYTAYLWIYFVHPFFTLTAALAAAINLARRSAGTALTGFMFFFIWGFTEMAQQSLTLIARHQIWSAAYRRTSDEASRAAIANFLQGYDAVWDGLYALIVVAFLLANLLYGIAAWKGPELTRYVSWAYLAAAFLGIFTVGSGLGWWNEPAAVDWIYPLIQPAARAFIGVWLWRTGPIDFRAAS